MRSVCATVLVGAVAGASCGGAAPPPRPAPRAQAFDCRQRTARYVAAHHLAGNELGVQVDCAEDGPRIKRWRIDNAGTHQEDAHSLTPGEFEAVWREIDGTGWAGLRDCAGGAEAAPVYRFEIQDDQQRAAFQCQSQAMPYPYNDIVDPLDLAAQRGRRQLGRGDDEPREVKARGRQAKQP